MARGYTAGSIERPPSLPPGGTDRAEGGAPKELPALIAHEFRTPLAVIEGAAQLLELFGRDSFGRSQPEAMAELAKIHRAVHRLQRLVDGYLVEDRVGDHSLPFRPIDVDIAVIVAAVCRNHTRLSGRDIELGESGPAPAKGDPELLRVLFDNLVVNALKFSPPTAPVRVTVRQAEGQITVAVTDCGIGIAAGECGRIFDKYFRGEAVIGLQGIGLGLYLVRRILDLHGGAVTLDSTAGQGSTFTVRLPAATA